MKKLIALFTACLMVTLSFSTAFASVDSPEQDREILVSHDSTDRPAVADAEETLDKGIASAVPDLENPDSYKAIDIFEVYTSDDTPISGPVIIKTKTNVKPGTDFKLLCSTDGGKTFKLVEPESLDDDGTMTITVDSLSVYAILVNSDANKSNGKSSPQTGETTSEGLVILCVGLIGLGCVFAAKARKKA